MSGTLEELLLKTAKVAGEAVVGAAVGDYLYSKFKTFLPSPLDSIARASAGGVAAYYLYKHFSNASFPTMIDTAVGGFALYGLYEFLTVTKNKFCDYAKDPCTTVGKHAKGFIEKIWDCIRPEPSRWPAYLVPLVFDSYDAEYEATLLAKDPNIACKNFPKQRLECALQEAYNNHYIMRGYARFADTADKILSIAGIFWESVAGHVSGNEGRDAHRIEETIEISIKSPLLIYFAYKKKFWWVASLEAATFALPGFGDVYDIVTNLYVRTMDEIIREEAKDKLLKC